MGRDDKYQQFEFADTSPRRSWNVPWKILLALAVLGAAAAWVWHFERPRLEQALEGTPLETAPLPATARVYKWQDANGAWNLTDRPPPAGTPYEIVR